MRASGARGVGGADLTYEGRQGKYDLDEPPEGSRARMDV
jgi:hypothetical protein